MIGVRQLLKFQSPSAEFSLTSAFHEFNVLAGSRFRLAVSTSVPEGGSEQLPEMSGGLRMHGPGSTPPAVMVLAEGPTDARRESVLDVANSAFRQTLPTRIFDCGLTGNRPYFNRKSEYCVRRSNWSFEILPSLDSRHFPEHSLSFDEVRVRTTSARHGRQ